MKIVEDERSLNQQVVLALLRSDQPMGVKHSRRQHDEKIK
jgi:hypothetical protein